MYVRWQADGSHCFQSPSGPRATASPQNSFLFLVRFFFPFCISQKKQASARSRGPRVRKGPAPTQPRLAVSVRHRCDPDSERRRLRPRQAPGASDPSSWQALHRRQPHIADRQSISLSDSHATSDMANCGFFFFLEGEGGRTIEFFSSTISGPVWRRRHVC